MKTEDKEIDTRNAFDTSGPSIIKPTLRRSEAATLRARKSNAKSDITPQVGWSIGKTDSNIQFLAENRRNFGTRKVRSRT